MLQVDPESGQLLRAKIFLLDSAEGALGHIVPLKLPSPGMLKTAFWGLQPLKSIYPGKIQVVGWAEAVLSIPGLNGCSPGRGLR